MSGGDDFRTQYRDWGMGEQQREHYYNPDPDEKAKILAYVYQHGATKVQEWLDQAVLLVAKEKEAKKETKRQEEIKRLQAVVEEGDAARKRLQEIQEGHE